MKELESKVAERDAMIKVLQKHTSAAYDSGASLRNNSSREELGKSSLFLSLLYLQYAEQNKCSARASKLVWRINIIKQLKQQKIFIFVVRPMTLIHNYVT